LYQFIVLVVIIIIGFLVCKKNYKNRANYINNNLLEYCYSIVSEFEILSSDEQAELKNSLNDKELKLFNALLAKDVALGKNLSLLQNHMFILESIMTKLKDSKK